jgi:oligopeptidase A
MENPLLNLQFPIPFDRIRPEHVVPAIDELIEDARQGVEDLTAQTAAPDFENTMRPLDRLTEPLDRVMGVVKHLESVGSTPELRAALGAVEPRVSDFRADLHSNQDLWKRVERLAASDEARLLDNARSRLLKRWQGVLRGCGAGLNAAGQERLAEIQRELRALTTRFAHNVHDATNAFELVVTSGEKLSSMGFPAVRAARASAERKGMSGWRFTLQPSSYTAVMREIPNAALREQAYRAYVTRAAAGAFDNRPLIPRILDLRRQMAVLLGYANFAEMTLAGRMVGSSEQALAFLADLRQKLQSRFLREREDLREYHGSVAHRSASPPQPWDIYFYASRQAGSVGAYSIPASYFPLEKVTAGLFEIARRIYGIRIHEEAGAATWNPEAKYYSIRDEDGTLLGGFYTDWFPRENKRAGAWMEALLTAGPAAHGFRWHLAAICTNVSRPSKGWPALLTHSDVRTIFHEFGHLLHHCLSRAEGRTLAGINVATDFIELPSQLMENWCWEREALELFARDHRTGLPIPDQVLWDAGRSRKFLSATRHMMQIGIGVLDLLLHTSYRPETDGDAIDYSRRVLEPYSLTPLLPEDASVASFTHLFASPVGYGAGYYAYKWTEVLAADVFNRFRTDGVLHGVAGREFRERILAKGGTEDPCVLYRDFMGRDPDPEAFLKREGLN